MIDPRKSRRRTPAIAVCALSLVVALTGCREESSPDPSESADASQATSGPSNSESPSGTTAESEETLEILADSVEDVMGSGPDIDQGKSAAELLKAQDEFVNDVDLEPESCMENPAHELIPEDWVVTGTDIDASDPGSRTFEQLGVINFPDEDTADDYLSALRDYTEDCDTSTGSDHGATIKRTMSIEDLTHHTDDSLAVHQSVAYSAAGEDDSGGDEDAQDEGPEAGDDKPESGDGNEPSAEDPMAPSAETTTVYVRSGSQVYSYWSSSDSDLSVSLSKIDELAEAVKDRAS